MSVSQVAGRRTCSLVQQIVDAPSRAGTEHSAGDQGPFWLSSPPLLWVSSVLSTHLWNLVCLWRGTHYILLCLLQKISVRIKLDKIHTIIEKLYNTKIDVQHYYHKKSKQLNGNRSSYLNLPDKLWDTDTSSYLPQFLRFLPLHVVMMVRSCIPACFWQFVLKVRLTIKQTHTFFSNCLMRVSVVCKGPNVSWVLGEGNTYLKNWICP